MLKNLLPNVEYHRKICSCSLIIVLRVDSNAGCSGNLNGQTDNRKQAVRRTCPYQLWVWSAGYSYGRKFYSNIRLAGGGMLFDSAIHELMRSFLHERKTVDIKRAIMIMDKGFDLHTEAEVLIKDNWNNCFRCKITVSCLQETIRALEFVFEKAVVLFTFESNQVTFGQYRKRVLYPLPRLS